MASILLDNVTKRFADRNVVDEMTLEIRDKEFLVLLGPSGCGKSTLLRMIAGLEPVSSGRIRIDGRDATSLEPKERDLAFVFQSYALYPHMTVKRNISFPLLMRMFHWWHHVPILGQLIRRRNERTPAIQQTVGAASTTLGLDTVLTRLPGTLSGGQRQRVAVGRAMVREPTAYLMDEPLSNLDAKLRVHMRREISRLHRTVDKTFIYVTHDQTEAMTMGTRIAVMREGVLQQHGTPREVFEEPANVFVARFIGSPPMNVIPGTVADSKTITIFGTTVQLGPRLREIVKVNALVGRSVLIGVRPEAVKVDPSGTDGIVAKLHGIEHLGSETLVSARLSALADDDTPLLSGDDDHEIVVRLSGYETVEGPDVRLLLDLSAASLFDPATEQRYTSAESQVRA